MTASKAGGSESRGISGGQIPGSGGLPAFELSGPEPSRVPILIAVPHAGRAYTGTLLEGMRSPASAALKLEDRYIDLIGQGVARATGAKLLVAHAPRAMIDLNRAADDVDWEMFASGAGGVGSYTPGRRARSGLGLIPRRLPGLGELWKRHHDAEELSARIDGIHEPYHGCLSEALSALRERWGAALLLDLHSMPSLPATTRQGVPLTTEFVLGDRFGATCDGGLVGSAFAYLAALGRGAAHNRPYAGGYVLERHAAPARGLHALQMEVDRASYLDSRLAEPGPGLDAMVDLLAGLVRRLAAEVAALGSASNSAGWAEAAE